MKRSRPCAVAVEFNARRQVAPQNAKWKIENGKWENGHRINSQTRVVPQKKKGGLSEWQTYVLDKPLYRANWVTPLHKFWVIIARNYFVMSAGPWKPFLQPGPSLLMSLRALMDLCNFFIWGVLPSSSPSPSSLSTPFKKPS